MNDPLPEGLPVHPFGLGAYPGPANIVIEPMAIYMLAITARTCRTNIGALRDVARDCEDFGLTKDQIAEYLEHVEGVAHNLVRQMEHGKAVSDAMGGGQDASQN